MGDLDVSSIQKSQISTICQGSGSHSSREQVSGPREASSTHGREDQDIGRLKMVPGSSCRPAGGTHPDGARQLLEHHNSQLATKLRRCPGDPSQPPTPHRRQAARRSRSHRRPWPHDQGGAGRQEPSQHLRWPGDDTIEGGNGQDILVGGPGNDTIYGRHANDLIVGDNYDPEGEAIGYIGRDRLYGGAGNDVFVGDNLASGDAGDAKPDRLSGNTGADTLIADDPVTGSGTADDGAGDWVAAMQGDDLVIGDSFSTQGRAIGSGDDVLNHSVGSTFMIGDSATLNGTASGAGNDALHAMTGGDLHQECHRCHNRIYGDSYAVSGWPYHRRPLRPLPPCLEGPQGAGPPPKMAACGAAWPGRTSSPRPQCTAP
jgi:hypothetical protein